MNTRRQGSGLKTIVADDALDAAGPSPTHAQLLVEEAGTRPGFFYGDGYDAATYIDGTHHDYPERKERGAEQAEAMEDLGYMVIRFGHRDKWEAIIAQYPYVFGSEG